MEDAFPPSYETAINRDAWTIIAPYIPSSDLCAALLVCRRWHEIFAPFLWGDPASHFGTEDDTVYVALTRFKRTLQRARLSVRQLTHTLRLPPALSEIYGGPKRTWLRDVLEYLPNLQSLLVSRLPFFDHQSLVALRHASNPKEQPGGESYFPLYGLRLLLAAREPNSTSIGIAEAIRHFPNLIYLDLSFTKPAKDTSVLQALSNLVDLQVLKLRGIGLRDPEAEVFANAIGVRVRLLDLRNNQLTDSAVRSLLQACFLPPEKEPNPRRANTNRRAVEDWPLGLPPGPDFSSLDSLRSEDLDQHLLRQLTRPLTGRLAFEDIPHKGLTHLYIADNQLSVEGLNSLLNSSRLHILDGGSVDTARSLTRSRTVSSPTTIRDPVHFPGTQKLVPVLGTVASYNLTYLRLNYAVVTEKAPAKDVPSPLMSAFELPGEDARVELESNGVPRTELDASEPIFELSADPPGPKFELAGDCVHFALSPPVSDSPAVQPQPESIQSPVIRGEGAFAPEVVVNSLTPSRNTVDDASSDEEVVLNAFGTGYTTRKKIRATNGRAANDSSSDEEIVRNAMGTGYTTRKRPRPEHNPVTSSASNSEPSSAAIQAAATDFTPVPSATIHAAATDSTPVPSAARNAQIERLLRKRPGPSSSPISPLTSPPASNPSDNAFAYLHPSHLPHLHTLVLTDVPTHVPASSPVIPALIHFITACADEARLAKLLAQTNYSLPPGRSRISAEHAHARSLFALQTVVLEMAAPGPPKSKSGQHAALSPWTHTRQRLSWSKSSTGDRDSENLWSAAENDFSFFGEDECGIPENEPEKYFPRAMLDEKVYVGPDDELSETPGTPNSQHNFSQRPHSSSLAHTGDIPATPTMLHSPRNLPLGRPRGSFGTTDRPRPAPNPVNGRHELASHHASTFPMPSNGRPHSAADSSKSQEEQPEPTVDVVAELAKFRKEKKAEYVGAILRYRIANNPHNRAGGNGKAPMRSVSGGIGDIFVEGYWKAEVKIVRNAAPKGRSGVVDMYGNYFEKGYLYP